MAEYIDVTEYIKKLYEEKEQCMAWNGDGGVNAIIARLERVPTADVAPVVHGEWEETDWVEPDVHGFGSIRTPKAGLRCNRCCNAFKKELLWKDNFCPNCGVKMDGGKG